MNPCEPSLVTDEMMFGIGSESTESPKWCSEASRYRYVGSGPPNTKGNDLSDHGQVLLDQIDWGAAPGVAIAVDEGAAIGGGCSGWSGSKASQ